MDVIQRLAAAWLGLVIKRILSYLDDKDQTNFARVCVEWWQILKDQGGHYLVSDSTRKLVARKWGYLDPLTMDYASYLNMVETIEKPFRRKPLLVEMNGGNEIKELFVGESFIVLLDADLRISCRNRWSLQREEHKMQDWVIRYSHPFVSSSDGLLVVRRPKKAVRDCFLVVDIEQQKELYEYGYDRCYFDQVILKRHVLVTIRILRDGFLVKLRWLNTRQVTRKKILSRSCKIFGLKDEYLVVYCATNTNDQYIELRRLNRLDSVTRRINVDYDEPFRNLILSRRMHVADLIGDNGELRHFKADLVDFNGWHLESIRSHGKYVVIMHVRPVINSRRKSAFQIRLVNIETTPADEIYVYRRTALFDSVRVSLIDHFQIVVCYDSTVVSLDFAPRPE